ncbi:solute carrier family 35 member e2-like protein [Dermatophagoides farinae]|uniref:Solute carrier family 35 member e2-like protein n=1 Tax=Dermatophagoides farinae TaxID=6954 RepID=A0A9D4SHU6_DERFA|nr:solute carrier family 35 member e2-like protein [Dermatophagoides farinae]
MTTITINKTEYLLFGFNRRLIRYLLLWFIFSATTLFLNKYIVSYQNGDPMFLGVIQLFCCSIASYTYLKCFHSYFSSTIFNDDNDHDDKLKSRTFHQLHYLLVNPFKFALIGAFRLSTVALGLVALWYIPVSFAEMIKSSAPMFTMVISVLIIREKISLKTTLSLLPIMIGLSLCSAYEIHFNIIGFAYALLGNLSECTQNVLSKRILLMDKYEANQIQLFTSAYSIVFQIPYLYYFISQRFDWHFDDNLGQDLGLCINYVLCGLSFHLQTLTEYALLNMISPISHSVANTVKRALLIWLSVLVFGNPVTLMSWFGTTLVIIGVIVYNKTIQQQQQQQQQQLVSSMKHDDQTSFIYKQIDSV